MVTMPFVLNVLFILIFSFHFLVLFFFLPREIVHTYCVLLCVVFLWIFLLLIKKTFKRNLENCSPVSSVGFCEKATASSWDSWSNSKTFIVMQAGKTAHKRTAYHPMPHTQKTQGTRFFFCLLFLSSFLWPRYSSTSLRNTSSMPQSSLGGSTCTSGGCTHARKTHGAEFGKPE